MLAETAYAKINLALHVRERLPDGYHRLETLFAFARDGDVLTAQPSATLSLTIDGPNATGLSAGPDNLVLRAAQALREACGVGGGAALRLTKNLPVASGIGGGSADAAAALRLLARLWAVDIDHQRLRMIAGPLGADVPACVSSETVRGDGRGNRLSPVAGGALSGCPLLLVNPGVPLSTPAIFDAWDGVDRGALDADDPVASAIAGRNDLQPAAIVQAPAVGALIDWLAAQPGVVLARMSGSGATVFALFDSDESRDAAAVALHARHSGYWCLATGLR
jgi:4-diphosphocytidyl-2-C-methyl-D-erythritol kinase